MSARVGVSFGAGEGAGHSRSRTPVSGALLLQRQRDFRFVTAFAVKGDCKGKDDSDEVLFDVDKDWSPNAQELAQQIQAAIEDSQVADEISATEGDTGNEMVFSTSWEVSSRPCLKSLRSEHLHICQFCLSQRALVQSSTNAICFCRSRMKDGMTKCLMDSMCHQM